MKPVHKLRISLLLQLFSFVKRTTTKDQGIQRGLIPYTPIPHRPRIARIATN